MVPRHMPDTGRAVSPLLGARFPRPPHATRSAGFTAQRSAGRPPLGPGGAGSGREGGRARLARGCSRELLAPAERVRGRSKKHRMEKLCTPARVVQCFSTSGANSLKKRGNNFALLVSNVFGERACLLVAAASGRAHGVWPERSGRVSSSATLRRAHVIIAGSRLAEAGCETSGCDGRAAQPACVGTLALVVGRHVSPL